MIVLARVLLALGAAAMGGAALWFRHLVPALRGGAGPTTWHDGLGLSCDVLLLAGGLALLLPRRARAASALLAGVFLFELLWLSLPPALMQPLVEVRWEELGQSLIYVAGAWVLFLLHPESARAPAARGLRRGQILFALALPAIGLSHFFYLGLTAPLIPAWLPAHVTLSYFTGAAHIAAGIAILAGVLAPLAARLEATMVSLFTLLVWVPMILSAPQNAGDWSEIAASTAISGAAWAVAASFGGRR